MAKESSKPHIEDANIVEETPTNPPPPENTPVETPPPAPDPAPNPPADGWGSNTPLVDADEFINQFNTPKQNFTGTDGAAKPEGDGAATDTLPGDDPTRPTEGAAPKMTKGAYNASAKAVVLTVEVALVIGLGFWLKYADTNQIRTTDGEKAMLEEAWSNALEESGVTVSPWGQVILVTGMIYGPKVWDLYKQDAAIQVAVQAEIAKMAASGQIITNAAPTAAQQQAQPQPPPVNATPQYNPLANSAAQKVPIPAVRQNCPTCNRLAPPNKQFCDANCRSRYQADVARMKSGGAAIYIGKTREEADKIAKERS